jgi:hypothetical protein
MPTSIMISYTEVADKNSVSSTWCSSDDIDEKQFIILKEGVDNNTVNLIYRHHLNEWLKKITGNSFTNQLSDDTEFIKSMIIAFCEYNNKKDKRKRTFLTYISHNDQIN